MVFQKQRFWASNRLFAAFCGQLWLCSIFALACSGTTDENNDDPGDSRDSPTDSGDDERQHDPGNPTVFFGAAGDFGGRVDYAGSVMNDMLTRDFVAFFLLGDISYGEIEPEQSWCDWVHEYLGPTYPIEVMAGNHDEDDKKDGHILTFAECMPDRLDSDEGPGGYGVNFASDLGPVTFIATAPDLEVAGVHYGYAAGSSERDWVVAAIERAHSDGDWVVVGMHKNCVTIGNKSCEVGAEFPQMLIDHDVDLVLQGHDHNYQRTHSLLSMVENGVGVLGDSGSDGSYSKGAGTVFVIVGTAGRGVTTCSHQDSEFGNVAAHWCGEEATDTKGYLMLSASKGKLMGEYVTTAGTVFRDVFTIE